MAQRLVTSEDLQKYPELKSRGISANQHFDVDAYAQQQNNSTPPVAGKKSKPEPKTMIPEKENGKKEAPKKADEKKK